MDIICFAGNLYDQKPWTNRQQIMTRIAEMGNRVIYIESAKSVLFQMLKLLLPIRPEQKTIRWFRRLFNSMGILMFPLTSILSPWGGGKGEGVSCSEEREKNLYIFSLIKFLPTKYRFLRQLNYFLNLLRLKKEIKEKNMRESLLWLYTPDAVSLVGKLNESIIIYDCVDEYSAQPYYNKNFKGIDTDEEEILKKANIVFTTSTNLYNEKKKWNPNTYLTPNVGDYKHFLKATYPETQIAKDIENIPSPIIGFIGAIDDYKLDIELLSYLARKRADWSIVLIGPQGVGGKRIDASVLKNYKNIHFLGKKIYENLPNYLKGFNACIIPYKNNEYTKNCFPIKFFEYLATGKPVVVSGLPELERFTHLIKVAKDKEEFIRSISECLKYDPPEKREKRIELARENTWEKKTQNQIEIIIPHLYNKNNENRD